MMQNPTEYALDLGKPENSNEFGILSFSVYGDDTTKENLQFFLKYGMVWYYAFNHEEAIACFKKALSIDKKCAMAHWGISMCNGSNYNSQFMCRDSFPSASDAHHHAVLASKLAFECRENRTLSDIELDLIDALSIRFNPVLEDSGDQIPQNTLEFSVAMKKVYDKHFMHPCIASLYAEALMNFHPWHLWDLDSGDPLHQTSEILAVIEAGSAICPKHPGLAHFMVHVCEMSPFPERALSACAVLKTISPDAGHLVHMASHIYLLLGMWQDAVSSNREAQIADDKYALLNGVDNYYTGYRLHDMHTLVYSAMFAGDHH